MLRAQKSHSGRLEVRTVPAAAERGRLIGRAASVNSAAAASLVEPRAAESREGSDPEPPHQQDQRQHRSGPPQEAEGEKQQHQPNKKTCLLKPVRVIDSPLSLLLLSSSSAISLSLSLSISLSLSPRLLCFSLPLALPPSLSLSLSPGG